MMTHHRKGQIRIAESMAVMVVFFLLLLFGYSFYIKFQQKGFEDQLRLNSEHSSIQVAQRIYYLPELQCSTGYRLVRESCYDKLKLQKFKDLLEDDNNAKNFFYKEILDISTIEI